MTKFFQQSKSRFNVPTHFGVRFTSHPLRFPLAFFFKLENYLLQNVSLKFGTTLGNLEKRLNLIDDNEDDMRTNISIFKCILVKLGFLFVCDDNGNAVVKFPNLNYTRKLEIVYKILRIFQSKISMCLFQILNRAYKKTFFFAPQDVSSNVLKHMTDSNEKLGEELLHFFVRSSLNL